ncbi:LOB domain-containing protein 25-like [Prosopis cineraria]|uniref:LOB domain-containing protein 25-like n=1 Tax=Prosopis cineraria TaxID=364024 RepID=UPI0024107174|nr:LOB domain-containing protein 25-like [Prosopis cineraria]
MSSLSSSANPPCAACKMQRRKCTVGCVFAPYFPADNPRKFACVHKVFGASNVAKILNDINVVQREDAVRSLAYEAEARLRDPIYGCVGIISVLQHRLNQLQDELVDARKELATYIGPQALLPNNHHVMGFNGQELLTFNGGGCGGGRHGGYRPLGPSNVGHQVEAHHHHQLEVQSQQWTWSQKSEARWATGPYTRALCGI